MIHYIVFVSDVLVLYDILALRRVGNSDRRVVNI